MAKKKKNKNGKKSLYENMCVLGMQSSQLAMKKESVNEERGREKKSGSRRRMKARPEIVQRRRTEPSRGYDRREEECIK